MNKQPPMTNEEMKARIRRIREHFNVKPEDAITVIDFYRMVIEYDEVDPLTQEQADHFSETLVRGMKSLDQRRKAHFS